MESYKYIDDRKTIRLFTTTALLKKIFGGQPDNILKPVRELIKTNVDQFPLDQIKQKLKVTNKSFKFTEGEIEELLWTKYGNRYAFSVLSLLYPNLDYKNKFHLDHIFPRSLMRSAKKLKAKGLLKEQVDFCLANHDYIGNLQLLEGTPNQEKSDQPFDEWLNVYCPDDQSRRDFQNKTLYPKCRLKHRKL
ncbi:hypothetical protein NBRC111894_3516 [Sporolactobacillus inulinus]|uniref:GmrSD restriction endonucleases C-terminal domain-containing protein n=1 Tax=Sporolactobacillus inulinus TaxID=2078 RepID=A0A4Y1ZFL0_9BACL|nr:DUF1524 domain-containing protein [Sporolactobacillus inulinus]GAY77962.1 hypothetical protein NBRC111894_3516 [Sporolactobacillus inulinus]